MATDNFRVVHQARPKPIARWMEFSGVFNASIQFEKNTAMDFIEIHLFDSHLLMKWMNEIEKSRFVNIQTPALVELSEIPIPLQIEFQPNRYSSR